MKSLSRTEPNRLLRALVALSLAIHLVIFIHIAGIYRSSALSYIELTVQDVSRPASRSIPRPRARSRTPPQPQDVKTVKVVQQPILRFQPMKIDLVGKDMPDSLMESISVPEIPAVAGINLAHLGPFEGEVSSDYGTANSYLEMVKFKIERHKVYPDMARIRQLEGRVTVQFVITPAGNLKTEQVVKGSGHSMLDEAALQAVQSAAPFSRLPQRFFKGDLSLKLTVVFELM